MFYISVRIGIRLLLIKSRKGEMIAEKKISIYAQINLNLMLFGAKN